jgi:glycosyltransferase involved in cell wall biosynthesis
MRSGTPPQLWRLGGHIAKALQSVDCILSPSVFTAARHRAAGISRPIRHLPSFSPISPRGVRTLAPRPRFVYVGRLVRSKGVEQLLETVAPHAEWQLDVVGSGPLESALRQQFRDASHIQFHPMMEHANIPAMMAGATAVVVPSWGAEVFPLTILEAMSCGVPVVVRRAGGSAESVEATGGGLVYDTPNELEPLLSRLAVDAPFRNALADRAVQGVAEHYGEDRWFAHYFSIINDLMAAKSVGVPQ